MISNGRRSPAQRVEPRGSREEGPLRPCGSADTMSDERRCSQRCALQQVLELGCVYSRLTENRSQGSALYHLVQRNRRATSRVSMPQHHMATPCPSLDEAGPFECLDDLLTGQYWEPAHPTLTWTAAVTGWASRAASSSAVASSKYSSAASRTFTSASSTVSPWLIAPGNSAT